MSCPIFGKNCLFLNSSDGCMHRYIKICMNPFGSCECDMFHRKLCTIFNCTNVECTFYHEDSKSKSSTSIIANPKVFWHGDNCKLYNEGKCKFEHPIKQSKTDKPKFYSKVC